MGFMTKCWITPTTTIRDLENYFQGKNEKKYHNLYSIKISFFPAYIEVSSLYQSKRAISKRYGKRVFLTLG